MFSPDIFCGLLFFISVHAIFLPDSIAIFVLHIIRIYFLLLFVGDFLLRFDPYWIPHVSRLRRKWAALNTLLWSLLVVLHLAVYMAHNSSHLSALRKGARSGAGSGVEAATERRYCQEQHLPARQDADQTEIAKQWRRRPCGGLPGNHEGEEGRRRKEDGLQLAAGGAPVPQAQNKVSMTATFA